MRMEYFYEMWNWIDMMVISGMSECQKVNKCQYIKILKCRQRYQNFNRFQYGDVALKCPTNKKKFKCQEKSQPPQNFVLKV